MAKKKKVIKEEVVSEPIIEEVGKENTGKEIEMRLLDIIEIPSTALNFVPVRNDIFEFAGCEVKCIRNFGSRIFIKVLKQI